MKLSFVLPYLIYFSSFTSPMDQLDTDRVYFINQSPYSGIAVKMESPYSDKDLDEKIIIDSAAKLTEICRKDIWPVVYFNKAITIQKDGNKKVKNNEGINSLIVKDSKNLLLFYESVRIASIAAKKMNSPGIIIDLECYSNRKLYDIEYLASINNINEEQMARELMKIGSDAVDVILKNYERCKIWLLFTGLINLKNYKEKNGLLFGAKFSVSYIVIGMLERLKSLNKNNSVISGGEVSLGYCSLSIKELENKIKNRTLNYQKWIEKYEQIKLAGTIAPWVSNSDKTDWLRRGTCGMSQINNYEDFLMAIRILKNEYEYLWIYGATAANFNIFDSTTASKCNRLISEAIEID